MGVDQEGAAWDPLAALRGQLASRVAAADFMLSQDVRNGDLAWLEYRRATADGVAILEIFLWPGERTLVAELWNPGRLRAALRGGTVRHGAERHLVLQYGDGADQSPVIEEVSAAVAAWLAGAATRAG